MTLFLLFFLFHHKPPKQVVEYAHNATAALASFQDGSPESWLEAERIAEIAGAIDDLLEHPDNAEAKEGAINDAIGDLRSWDSELQTKMATLFPDTNQI